MADITIHITPLNKLRSNCTLVRFTDTITKGLIKQISQIAGLTTRAIDGVRV